MDSSLYPRRNFRSRGRITPPAFLSKVTHKTTEFINHLRGRIESPVLKTSHTTLLSRRRGDSSDGFSSGSNTNINNNIELNEIDTSSIKTTSTSSSAHSGFLGFTLPTTVDIDDPLPIPVCRLGKYQAEWNTGELGAWRLLTHDTISAIPTSQSGDDRNEPSLSVLKRMNKDLKEEQKFLLTKLNLLYDSLVKQTALVNQHERKLDQLRIQLKQRTENTPEDIRADLIHELNEQIEKTRSRQHLDLMSITESIRSESTDNDENTTNASKGQSSNNTNRLLNKNKSRTVNHDDNSSTIRYDETHSLYSSKKTTKDEVGDQNVDELSQEGEDKDADIDDDDDRDEEDLGDETHLQNERQNQKIRMDVKSQNQHLTGKQFSQIPIEKSKSSVRKFTENEVTSFDSSYTEMSASQSKGRHDTETSESESTESVYHHKSSDSSDDNVDVKSETLQESSSQEKDSKTEDNDNDDVDDDDDDDSDEDSSEEELTKTDASESESGVTESRQRVVQFGTVSRR
ncbi:unnamed protein product [Trichobilharzia szidati]|nr:unnamed protein product [Trichobilharzia szidati]